MWYTRAHTGTHTTSNIKHDEHFCQRKKISQKD